jgi:hypothetical protein
MTENVPLRDPNERRNTIVAALLMILIGAVTLVADVLSWDPLALLLLPSLGVVLLVWAFYTRQFGFTVPGCIITGLGVGLFLSRQLTGLTDTAETGTIVLGAAAGFLAITLITPFFQKSIVWWPLIPGLILGFIGILHVIGGQGVDIANWIGVHFWQLLLIGVGLYMVYAWSRERAQPQ